MSVAESGEASAPARPRAALWFLPAGVLIGFAGALCGIGGGIFAGPLLHAVRKLPLKRATATAILVVLATSVAATAAELVRHDSALAWPVVAPLALGALCGAELGFALSKRMDERGLKVIFVVVLVLAGVRLLFVSTALGGGFAPGAVAVALIALVIGVLGGTLTPLLGIAGGTLMVPALFLSLSQLGFGGARAGALAAGAVAALRTLWLHARAGSIEFALGLPLALGALLGAFGGVSAAHHPDLVHAGRVGLGVLLLAQAARFLVDVLRPRRAPPERG